jgi:hypothetical protein
LPEYHRSRVQVTVKEAPEAKLTPDTVIFVNAAEVAVVKATVAETLEALFTWEDRAIEGEVNDASNIAGNATAAAESFGAVLTHVLIPDALVAAAAVAELVNPATTQDTAVLGAMVAGVPPIEISMFVPDNAPVVEA